MEYNTLIRILASLFLVNSALSTDAHAGTGSIVARDTDKVSDLRADLIRLSNLLSDLEDGDENDLQKVTGQKKAGETPAKSAMVSEDMVAEKQKPVVPTALLSPKVKSTQEPAREKQTPNHLVPEDSSIQILSKALARLKEPKYNNGDSTGDYLGTDNNESGSDDERTQDMENMIMRALTRLSQGKNDDVQGNSILGTKGRPSDKPYNNGAGSRYPGKSEEDAASALLQGLTGQDEQLREEATRVVEYRLMQDILLARKFGISVDDLIKDLDNKAYKETKMKTLEEELNTLNLQK